MEYRIQSIQGQPGRTTYFVERKFGNLLLFADKLETLDYDFYKSRGGVYLQYIEDLQQLSQVHTEIFNKLGATAVSVQKFSEEPEPLAVREYCGGLDKEIKIFPFQGASIASFDQLGKKVWILGNQFYFSRQEKIFLNTEDITDDLLDQAEAKDVSLVLCSWHEANSVLELA
jgi:hypothetical protein